MELSNGWSYMYEIFTHFTLILYLHDHHCKNQGAKFLVILDRFTQWIDASSNMAKLWAIQVFKLAKMKGN